MDIRTAISKNPEAPPTRSLTPHDRCDRCGAQALVRVRLRAGTLDWCGHHFAKYEEGLNNAAVEIDDREALDFEEHGAPALNRG